MATDLSARSDRALDRAVALAQAHDAALTVVHVVDEGLLDSVAEAQAKAARETVREHIDTLEGGAPPRLSIEIVSGRAHVDIVEIAEQTQTDLIIVGMHREDAFKDMFRGTTAERIIRVGNFPVLSVRDRVGGPYRRIMVAVDFSVYSRRAIEFATSFAQGAEFYLVHAYEVPFQGFMYGARTQQEVRKDHGLKLQRMIDEEMARFLADPATEHPGFRPIVEEGSPHEVIRRQIDRLKPDLLVLGTHGRTGVAHAVLGSVAEYLLEDPRCDTLAIKAW